MASPGSNIFADFRSKITTRLDETPLSTVGSEIQLNQFKFMATSDTSFGEYQDTSPITFRALSPSPRRIRGSLILSGSMPLDVTEEEQWQPYERPFMVKTTKQIEDSYKGEEIPDTPSRDLPPSRTSPVLGAISL